MEEIKYVTITEREYLSLRKKHNKYMQFLDTLNKKIDEVDKLEERINKAIEYMEKIANYKDCGNYELFKEYEEYKELLKILKGIDNE